ncbi:MAG: response regulator, partial [Gemmatimonadetes bacterium]|nr:response regulator [Gemmatimonadota bacterium]NIQ54459.1 response regulator [Gemmatimonadota bacterium]NIU74669.1 response regulator [Gammaproteobacteria bacterium]NIX44598.1 response regulator [Gemmatimonadota bacterium]NIY08808.1 response regulator [Gemmatimonadota bacterium]
MEKRVGVLIVDDSPFIRRAVERMLAPLDRVEVVGTATNGEEAIASARRLRPDLIILDIVMPEVDGLEAIQEIMRTRPTPILVFSSHAQPGAETTLKALELGAVDFVSKADAGTRMDIYELAPVLQEKVLALAGARAPSRVDEAVAPVPEQAGAATLRVPTSSYDLLVLGASTGGPRALAAILSRLPGTFPAGIVVAQHMPPGF